MKNIVRISALAAALAFSASAQAGVNLIVNGEFQTPNFGGGWGNTSTGPGWFTGSADTIEIGNSGLYGLPCVNALCQNMEVNANISPDVSMQTVNGLVVGDYYKLTYLYGGRTSAPGTDVTSFGGVTLTTDSGSIGSWTTDTFLVKATSTSEVLSFTGSATACGGSCGNEIANVSLTGVPELSTWAMMLAGFGALGFAGSRRKAAVAA